MKKVKIIIERSEDHFSAYAENVEGIYGAGATVQEARQSVLEGIRLLVENNKPKNIPAILKEKYEVVFKFDAASFLNYYNKIFTRAGLERITGINQKLLHHYAKGMKKPRPAQMSKIAASVNKLGRELAAVEL